MFWFRHSSFDACFTGKLNMPVRLLPDVFTAG